MTEHEDWMMNMISVRERNLWAELLVDLLILAYYLPKALVLIQAGEDGLRGAGMGSLIGHTIGYAVVLAIALHIVMAIVFGEGKEEEKDERDVSFELRSYRFAYHVLIGFVVIIMGSVVLVDLFPVLAQGFPSPRSPLILAHYLLLSVSFASILQCATRLFYYRRGY